MRNAHMQLCCGRRRLYASHTHVPVNIVKQLRMPQMPLESEVLMNFLICIATRAEYICVAHILPVVVHTYYTSTMRNADGISSVFYGRASTRIIYLPTIGANTSFFVAAADSRDVIVIGGCSIICIRKIIHATFDDAKTVDE